jgi:TetR/AcrR family tetracycline transcriptional repressor
VLAAGRELLAERGLQALTMRALADRLRVAPNALYSYVGGKLELVDALLDDALHAIAAPAPDVAEPVEGLRSLMISTYEVLLRNPDLIVLYLTRQGSRGPNAQRLGTAMLGLLARLDLPEPVARQVVRVLIVYTIGSAAFTTEPDASPIHADDLRAGFTTAALAPPGNHPR